MLLSVELLHKNGLIHRDIKVENFLIKFDSGVDSNLQTRVTLTDFGLACQYDVTDPPTKYCGTLTSMAPEVLHKKPYD